MAARLKVFRAHLGFFDTIVAAPSQKAALEAWGANAHEFAHGFAAPTDDPKLVAAALAQPGIVLKRQFGSTAAFSAEPARLAAPTIPKSRQVAASKQRAKRDKAAAQKVVAAKLARIDREEADAMQDLADRQAALAAEMSSARKRFAAQRRQIKAQGA